MHAYIIRRLLIGLLIVWGVYTITFLAVNLAPGDPFTGQENAKVTEADLARKREKWGYNLPLGQRYLRNLRNMFYADPEILDYEGGGIRFEVSGREGGGYSIAARPQTPPLEVILKPTLVSAQDDGAVEVRLARTADGQFETKVIGNGQYRFGLRKLSVFAADAKLDSTGVVISYDAARGVVSAKDALSTPPETIQLVPSKGTTEPLALQLGPDGAYAPVDASIDRYVYDNGVAELLVPEEPLGTGGFTFDLGTSIQHNKPVFDYLKPKLFATLKLAFWALFFNYLLGIFLGVISAVRKDTATDHSIMVGAFFVYSMPGFWLALMLQLIFAVKLGWLPLQGMGDGTLWSAVQHYTMPVFVLGVAGAAGTARYQRSAVLEVMSEDYIRTARAKGLSPRAVVSKHVLRNSLLPVITLFGLSMPFLVSGAVITEQIFNWPGIGRAAIEAITSRDVMVVTSVTLLATVMVVIGNLLADVMYAIADPRVRLK